MIIIILILLACGVVVITIGVRVMLIYNTTSGTRWGRLLATAKQSATVLWLGFVGFVTAIFNGGMELAALAGTSQEVRDAITKYFDARVASAVIAGIVVVGIAARLRPKSSDPVS
jgi:hypothetical protein